MPDVPTPAAALGFDLGDTLLEYTGLPLSWVDHYPDALRALADALRVTSTSAGIAAGCEVLRRYNTRLNPREHEISFDRVLEELLPCLHATADTADVAGFRKPAAATLRALATALGCSAAELAYVGNEEKDVAAARHFGCQAILLDRTQRRPAWGQTRTIASLLELTESRQP